MKTIWRGEYVGHWLLMDKSKADVGDAGDAGTPAGLAQSLHAIALVGSQVGLVNCIRKTIESCQDSIIS